MSHKAFRSYGEAAEWLKDQVKHYREFEINVTLLTPAATPLPLRTTVKAVVDGAYERYVKQVEEAEIWPKDNYRIYMSRISDQMQIITIQPRGDLYRLHMGYLMFGSWQPWEEDVEPDEEVLIETVFLYNNDHSRHEHGL